MVKVELVQGKRINRVRGKLTVNAVRAKIKARAKAERLNRLLGKAGVR